MFRRVSSWDQQPQDWAELSELARQLGASDLLLPVGPTLAPVNSLLTSNGTSGTLSETVNAQGRGVQFTTGGAYYLDRGANDPRDGYWWMIVGSISNVATWSGIFSRTRDNGTTQGLAWQRQSSTDVLSVYHGAARTDVSGINALQSTDAAVWFGTWRKSDGAFVLYKNGIAVKSGTLTTAPDFLAGQGQIKVFSSRDTAQTSGVVNMAAFGTVTPTAAQVGELSGNPWALLQRREWVFSESGTAGGAQSLTPSLYTNANDFYPATVAPGAVSLAPSLFTNSNTSYSATVSLGGSPQTLTPELFTNSQSFFAPTVSPGAVSLAPALFTNTQTFYAPVVTNGVTLAPPLLTNSQTFYGASITLGPAVLRPALLANVNQFYTHALTGGVVRIKQKGLRKTRYTPGRVPSEKELPRFLQNEFERLTDALESPYTHHLLEVLHAEPTRKPTGSAMVAFADGTDWNPGAGRGLYLYDPQTAAWTKL